MPDFLDLLIDRVKPGIQSLGILGKCVLKSLDKGLYELPVLSVLGIDLFCAMTGYPEGRNSEQKRYNTHQNGQEFIPSHRIRAEGPIGIMAGEKLKSPPQTDA